MTNPATTLAVLSMLHEPADRHSGNRLFRGKPVLDWTLRRLTSADVDVVAVQCWSDQINAVRRVVGSSKTAVVDRGDRSPTRAMQSLTTARRWADGWRGGLLGSCEFDLGFHAPFVAELMALHDAETVLLVDPASALIDPGLIDAVLDHADAHPSAELCFTQSAPGLAPVLLRKPLVDRLAIANVHPGRMLTYFPGQHGVDPVGKDGCVTVPTVVARTTDRFKIDSDRQVDRFDRAFAHLNGHLIETAAEQLVIARGSRRDDAGPRDVTVELTTRRATRPVFSPAALMRIDRPDLAVDSVKKLFRDLCRYDDVRLTLGGVGDPLLHPGWGECVEAARAAGIQAIHLETDLIDLGESELQRLVDLRPDVISVHLPAATAPTYNRVMGIDRFGQVMQNVARLEAAIAGSGSTLPLICMVFTKMADNLGEMEVWYDYWLQRQGHAVIVGPSDYAGQIPDRAVADMAPPKCRACARLTSSLTVLSNGRVSPCTQDCGGRHPIGDEIELAWEIAGRIRTAHEGENYSAYPLCPTCKEWHRR